VVRVLAARFGAHVSVTGAASSGTHQYLEVRPELICSGRFLDDADFVYLKGASTDILKSDGLLEERDGRLWDLHGQF
jgi:alpha-galactosidase